jgi:hypothetical protein
VVDDANANNDQYKFSECECVSVCWRLREEFVIFGQPNIVQLSPRDCAGRNYWTTVLLDPDDESEGGGGEG